MHFYLLICRPLTCVRCPVAAGIMLQLCYRIVTFMLQLYDNYVTFPVILANGRRSRKILPHCLQEVNPQKFYILHKIPVPFLCTLHTRLKKNKCLFRGRICPIKRTPRTGVNPRKLYHTRFRKSSTF